MTDDQKRRRETEEGADNRDDHDAGGVVWLGGGESEALVRSGMYVRLK